MLNVTSRSLARLLTVAGLLSFGASYGCTSTLGLDEYEITSLDRCGDALVDRSSDPNHCGQCGVVCPGGSLCVAGSCECPDALSFCTGANDVVSCVDLDADTKNCGACGTSCASGASCVTGECECDEKGQTVCSQACVDLETDEDNCGTCGNACALGASCLNEACKCDVAGNVPCAGSCTDPLTDANNCNGCGTVCDIPNAVNACDGGKCEADTCQGDYLDCNLNLYLGEKGDGCEIDGASDDENCGACGNECLDGKVCDGSVCVCDVPEAGGECDPRTNCGCELGTSCAFDGSEWSCIVPGYTGIAQNCLDDTDCVLGSSCVGGVCYEFCNGDEIESGTCSNLYDSSGTCLQIADGNGNDIDAYQACVSTCSPPYPYEYPPYPYSDDGSFTSCNGSQQCIVAGSTSLCVQQMGYGQEGTACDSYQDCAQGYGCVDSVCSKFCYTDSACQQNYPYNGTCESFSTPVELVGDVLEVGYCDDGIDQVGCSEPCENSEQCPSGATCQDIIGDGYICVPEACQYNCFAYGDSCNWDIDTCTFSYCSAP